MGKGHNAFHYSTPTLDRPADLIRGPVAACAGLRGARGSSPREGRCMGDIDSIPPVKSPTHPLHRPLPLEGRARVGGASTGVEPDPELSATPAEPSPHPQPLPSRGRGADAQRSIPLLPTSKTSRILLPDISTLAAGSRRTAVGSLVGGECGRAIPGPVRRP